MSKEIIENLGMIIKNSKDMHDEEFEVGFNMHTNTFFRKFISKELLDKGVWINSSDFYKGLIVLNYYGDILGNGYNICDNLKKISKSIKEHAKENKDDKRTAHLSIDLIAVEIGLFSKENNPPFDYKYADKRMAKYCKVISGDIKQPDPYFLGIGSMAYDLASDERKKYLNDAKSISDIESVVFCDALMNNIKDEEAKKAVIVELEKNEYRKASIAALDGLKKEVDRVRLLVLIKEHLKV